MVKSMPMIVAILGYVVGGGFMLLGIIGFFHHKKPYERVLAELSTLRTGGAGLLNKGLYGVKDNAHANKWWQEVEEWRRAARSRLSRLHSADADNWETLGTIEPRVFANAYSSDVNHKLTMLATWLEKLQQYIDTRTRG